MVQVGRLRCSNVRVVVGAHCAGLGEGRVGIDDGLEVRHSGACGALVDAVERAQAEEREDVALVRLRVVQDVRAAKEQDSDRRHFRSEAA